MGQPTSEDYLKAVRACYLEQRMSLHAGILADPSNANIRDLCLLLFRGGLTKSDEEVFLYFFKVAQAEDLERIISKFDIERFRPILNFLRGQSHTTDIKNLNLIAVLIGFPRRPLPKFLQTGEVPDKPFLEPPTDTEVDQFPPEALDEQRTDKGKIKMYWVGVMLFLGATAVFFFAVSTPDDQCMIWQKDHYIMVNCQDTTYEKRLMAPLDNEQFRLRRLKASKNMVFFIDGKPQVWYLKNQNRYEFFDRPGYHPFLTHKKLHVITPYVAMKVKSGEIPVD